MLALLVLGTALVRLPGLEAAERSSRPLAPGVRLLQWSQDAGPQALQAVEVDRAEAFIQLGVSLGGGNSLRLEPLSRQAERLTRPERYPVAGVNGDFFYYPNARNPGIPTNAAIVDDELVRTPFTRSCLVLNPTLGPQIRILKASGAATLPDGAKLALSAVNGLRAANQLVLYTPRFGESTRTETSGTEVYLEPERFPLRPNETHRARVRAVQTGVGAAPIAAGNWVLSGSGEVNAPLKALKPGDTVELRVDFTPALQPGEQVLGGGPRLVRDGRVSVEAEGGSVGGSFSTARHPRTAIGFNGSKVYLVVVDGRQPGYSLGMSLAELAQVMADLGCTDALNMDGGGSTTLWARGAVTNRPSDGRERPVANGLLVFSTAPKGEPVRIVPQPGEISALAGAEAPLQATGEDKYYNPVPLPAEVQWSVPETLGAVRDGRFVAREDVTADPGKEFAAGELRATAGEVAGVIPVRVYPRPVRLEILPATARVGTTAQQPFRVRALDAQGRPVLLPAKVRWSAAGEAGTMDETGTLVTPAAPGLGMVTATVNGVSATARVEVVATTAGGLDGFETDGNWRGSVVPAGNPGEVRVAEGTARSGKRALRLEYDFSAGTGTRAVYANGSRTLGQPIALRFWVYGDGQNAWLRVKLRDGKGQTQLLDAARRVDWKGTWKEVRVPISEDIPTPLTLESIYVIETDAAKKPKGVLFIDDLTAEGGG